MSKNLHPLSWTLCKIITPLIIALILVLLTIRPASQAAEARSELLSPLTAHPFQAKTHQLESTGYKFAVEKQFEETSYYLKDTDFISSTLGWAVGVPHWDQAVKAYVGTIIKTDDGADNWIAQTVPTAKTLNGVDFIDPQSGWTVGTDGTILHTDDGGGHWVIQSIATTDELRSVAFANSSHGWATSVRPTHYNHWDEADNWHADIWHTADGGATWITQTLPISASILHDIEFIDPLHGWAVGVKYIGNDQYGDPEHRAAVYHTTNGGQTWTEQPLGTNDYRVTLTAVDFLDASHGWAVGFNHVFGSSDGVIFHTEDGGQTWEQQAPNSTLWAVQFIDQNRGYAAGFDYIGAWGPPVYRTQDGGATWEKVRMARHESDGLFGLTVTEDRVVALGDHDYQVVSTDPWGPYSPPYGEDLFTQGFINIHYRFEGVFFVDENHGWATGSRSFLPELSGQVIFHTTDGGQTWEEQYKQAPPMDKLFSVFRLDGVYFTDTNNGWAVGMSEYDESYDPHWAILHTSDGGLHWEEQGQDQLYDGLSPEFFDVQFLDEQNGWALNTGHSDPELGKQALYLARTNDGGVTWEWVPTGIPGYFNIGFALVQGSLDFPDSQHGWAAGGLGTIIHTEDGGSTWITQTLTCDWPECPKRLYGLDFIDDQTGWISGEGLYYTADGGTHWAMHEIDLGVDLHDIQFVDAANGWTAGGWGVILYTTNGGLSWSYADNDISASDILGISFVSPEKGWLVGDHGAILTTVQVPYWPIYLPLVTRSDIE